MFAKQSDAVKAVEKFHTRTLDGVPMEVGGFWRGCHVCVWRCMVVDWGLSTGSKHPENAIVFYKIPHR